MNQDDIKRIHLRFNLRDKQDREIYQLLSKKRNKTAFIRMAIEYFAHGVKMDPVMEEAVRKVVGETVREELKIYLPEIVKESLSGLSVEQPKKESAMTKLEIKRIDDAEQPEEEDGLKPEEILNMVGIEDMF